MKSLADQLSKLFLVNGISSQTPSSLQRFIDGDKDSFVAMAIDPSCKFSKEIDVPVAVDGREGIASARSKCYWESSV